MNNLIISLTTIHSRIDKIHKVIKSLLAQKTDLDFKVLLYVSKDPYLLDEGVKSIPVELKRLINEYPESFEVRYTENIGPYRKFIPILKDYFLDQVDFSYLVTVDDDTVYPSTWLSGLVNGCEKYDCVVAYRGRQINCDKDKIHSYRSWRHSNGAMLEPNIKTVGTGKDGIIYKPEYFHPDVVDIDSALIHCNHADDLWLKIHTSINGVPSVLLSESLSDAFEDLGEKDENTLYRKINKHGGNDRALQNLHKYFLSRYRVNILDVFNLNSSASSTWMNSCFTKSYFN